MTVQRDEAIEISHYPHQSSTLPKALESCPIQFHLLCATISRNTAQYSHATPNNTSEKSYRITQVDFYQRHTPMSQISPVCTSASCDTSCDAAFSSIASVRCPNTSSCSWASFICLKLLLEQQIKINSASTTFASSSTYR